jgi:hypothetical protein
MRTEAAPAKTPARFLLLHRLSSPSLSRMTGWKAGSTETGSATA